MKKLLILAATVVTLSLAAVAATGAAADGADGPFSGFLGKVAEKLGVSQEQLETAIQEVQLETIDEAVAEGRITEEQADKLRERSEDGVRLFPRRPQQHRGAGLIVESAALVLGMEKPELAEQLKDGSSLAEVAGTEGMRVEEFTAALLSEIQTQIDQMVADGKLTAEQAEQLSQKIEESIDRIVNGQHQPGPHRWRRHGLGDGSPTLSPASTEITL